MTTSLENTLVAVEHVTMQPPEQLGKYNAPLCSDDVRKHMQFSDAYVRVM